MNVAIAGYGIEGKASYDYWRARGDTVTIVDERELSPDTVPTGSDTILGKDAFASLAGFDLVVRTPGLPPARLESATKVWSATNEFFAVCPAPIIGVTGTKGKGTTASLIASILREAGRTVHLVGNIGAPALAELPLIAADDFVVYELSSFQLWDTVKSPQVAVVLMIEADHLDVHPDFEDYLSAKANIRRHQQPEDICIYHPTNLYAKRIAEAGQSAAPAVRYAVPDDGQVYYLDGSFYVQEHAICSVEALQLVGEHNIENACAAISAARIYGADDAAVERGLRSFTGLPHRLKHVRDVRGVSYYDDSIATTPGSALAAIRSLPQPKLLILGGKDKGSDYTELITQCQLTGTHVLAIGANGPRLAALCRNRSVEVTEIQGPMSAIVTEAQRLAPAGSAVILSPAASSFDMFKNYRDRGEQFVAAVEGLS